MGKEVMRELVVRMSIDPEFAQRVKLDPDSTLSEYGLTADEVTQLRV